MISAEALTWFNQIIISPSFVVVIALFQLAELWKLSHRDNPLAIFTFIGFLILGCTLVVYTFLNLVADSQPHSFWQLGGLMLVFILLSSYVLVYLADKFGYLLSEKKLVQKIVGPNWVKWLDVIYLAFAFGALIKALNSQSYGVNPSAMIERAAPLLLASAISVRLTKAFIEIYDLNKKKESRW